MNKNKILHVMVLDKFLPPFIDFVDEHFERENHHYTFITSEKYEYGLTPEHNVEFLHTDDDIFITLLEYMKIAKKIILHGLWRDKVDVLLYFNQELLKKCYWIMWGGDFYFPETKSKIRHEIIKNIGFIITANDDDYKLAKTWYNTNASRVNSFVYPSNLYKEYNIKIKQTNTINILVGNSATETNNHYEIFDKLLLFKNKEINIYTPLSYGNKQYAGDVIQYGKKLFQNKFIALTNFLPSNEYLDLLATIDIAIFNHERQQAFGNIITLLGLGKKVYINSKSNLYNYFISKNICIFNTNNEINLNQFDISTKNINKTIIKNLFSKQNLRDDLNFLFKLELDNE